MIYADLSEKYLAIISEMMKQPTNKKSMSVDAGENGILSYLIKHNSASPSELQKHLNVGSSRVANALTNLQGKGLIYRQNALDDRRKVVVSITEKGKLLQDKKRKDFLKHFTLVFAQMGEDDAGEFLRLLEKFMIANQMLFESERKEG